jgi:UrcA family protein
MTKSFLIRSAASIAVGVFACASFPTLALAAVTANSPELAVGVSGVDLTTDAGVAIMHGKVRRAAEKLCQTGQYTLAERLAGDNCFKRAVADGNAKIEALRQKKIAENGTPDGTGRTR